MKRARGWCAGLSVVGLLLIGTVVQAQTYVSQGPFVAPGPGGEIVWPTNVGGKEYSHNLDKDETGAFVPGQVLHWDGVGGVMNRFNYGEEVDALANIKDALFMDVVGDNTNLLFSVSGDGNVYYSGPSSDPKSGVWATPAEIDANGVTDLDGLQIWGSEGAVPDPPGRFAYSTCYSLVGDGTGTSVFWFDLLSSTTAPYISRAEIAAAVGLAESEVDVDAMVIYEQKPNPPSGGPPWVFEDGDAIIFSLAPAGLFDGGEIWVYTKGAGPATFLQHGGYTWNTALDVSGTFGVASENVNALEATSPIAEPTAAALLGFGIALDVLRRRRRT